MANIHFYLQSGKINKNGEQPIVMRITHQYIRPVFFIGYVCKSNHWSQTNEKVKKQREDETDNNYIAINERISLFKELAEKAIKCPEGGYSNHRSLFEKCNCKSCRETAKNKQVILRCA